MREKGKGGEKGKRKRPERNDESTCTSLRRPSHKTVKEKYGLSVSLGIPMGSMSAFHVSPGVYSGAGAMFMHRSVRDSGIKLPNHRFYAHFLGGMFGCAENCQV